MGAISHDTSTVELFSTMILLRQRSTMLCLDLDDGKSTSKAVPASHQ